MIRVQTVSPPSQAIEKKQGISRRLLPNRTKGTNYEKI